MTRRLLLFAILGLVFGGVFGFLGTWIGHVNEVKSPGSGQDGLSLFFELPSLPGNLITWQQHGAYDWGIDEDWDYRVPITLWNGVFWSVAFAVIGAIWSWWRAARVNHTSHATDP